jgi:hypothetical protein
VPFMTSRSRAAWKFSWWSGSRLKPSFLILPGSETWLGYPYTGWRLKMEQPYGVLLPS